MAKSTNTQLPRGLYLRSTGIYQFRMDVPKDLQAILSKTVIKVALGFDKPIAVGKAVSLRDKYKRIFWDLRNTKTTKQSSSASAVQLLEDHGIPARKLVGDEDLELPESFEELTKSYKSYQELPPVLKEASDILRGVRSITIEAACKRYIKETGKKDIRMAVDQFKTKVGDIDITLVRREHVYAYREYLVSRNNSPETQRKRIGALSRLFTFASSEFSLVNLGNPFKNIRFEQNTKEAKIRYPFTDEEYSDLIKLCIEKGDERRTALAVIAVTGARLSEITGLLKKDIHLDHKAIDIYENADRTLKTKNSRRSVPIVDAKVMKLLAKCHKLAKKQDDPIFPSVYGKAKANTASATLIKFIRSNINKDRMVHEIRHTVATKLKRVLTPEPVIQEILGWKSGGMIGTYAGNLDLATKQKWLKKALS
jgi:integrase